jgi:hypothetical protein
MIISFFEEYPTKKNLAKLNLIKFPTKLYLAAYSLKEFNDLKKKIKNKYVKEIIYWPLLTKKEGYWFSGFSKRSGVKRVLNELAGEKVPLMLDLELPTTRNPWLYLTQLHNFGRNKRLIRKFIKDYEGEIYTSEYFPRKRKLFSFLGINYVNTIPIKMLYHSMHNYSEEFLQNYCQENKMLGFGTIAVGVQEDEPILAASQLDKDLKIAKKNGVKEVVIFRLGGLNKEYVKVMKI